MLLLDTEATFTKTPGSMIIHLVGPKHDVDTVYLLILFFMALCMMYCGNVAPSSCQISNISYMLLGTLCQTQSLLKDLGFYSKV